ncbi:hypothetical protein ACFV5N_17515 [Streptomyces sp. NPDC059853]|uniref:hypothetical protein n=1 Tax=Streptomyces sp. NPDC059853 TaxID=3346973 RepID=UPI00365826A4
MEFEVRNEKDPRATFERLKAIDWLDDSNAFDHIGSRMALMREYLRRSANWADTTGATDSWPFFDIGATVDPGVQVDAGLAAEMEEFIYQNVTRGSIKNTCWGALHWAALRPDALAGFPALDDPYEPLLLMYERGGVFTVEGSFINVTGGMVLHKNCEDHLSPHPITALDETTLDSLDAADSR